jgi:hypothetical protein
MRALLLLRPAFGLAVIQIARGLALLLAILASRNARADDPDQQALQLKRLVEIVARYQIESAGDQTPALDLRTEPVLRWNSPRVDIRDAGVFLWLEGDRPRAVVGPYISPAHGGLYVQFHSLSQNNLVARESDKKPFWTAEMQGLTWAPVPAAPLAADSPRGRLSQMRSLAAGFEVAAIKEPPAYDPGSTWHLRLMPQPLYRYGDGKDGLVDGAVFALSLGTDPEAFLLLEARSASAKGASWHFSFAPWCESELRARYDGREVWNRPHLRAWDSKAAYFRLGPFPEPGFDSAAEAIGK